MRLTDYLRDRLPYIAVYFLTVALILVIVQLDILGVGATLRSGNVLYILILASFFLGLLLVTDYVRKRPYYKQLQGALREGAALEDALNIQSGIGKEQQMVQKLIRINHARYAQELARYQQQHQEHQRFITQWAHAMKTPVSVIDLLVQQAQEVDDLETARKHFHSIQEENERLGHGLEMMLSIARLQNFELDLNPERIDLKQLAREAINKHKKEFILHEIFPKLAAEEGPVYVESDRKWLAIVLRQLVANAIKYTAIKSAAASSQLRIILTRKGQTVFLSVSDDGVGIPEQDLPRIFDPFFTGENGRLTTRSTGLGLYLVKRICSKLGHEISVKSEAGAGTTVTITFAPQSHIKEALTP